MAITTPIEGAGDLGDHGLDPRGEVHYQPSTSQLYVHALAREEARLAEGGPLVVDTGRHTGRSPKDRFVVREPESEDRIAWGDVNQPLEEEQFEGLRAKVVEHLEEGDDVYVIDAFAGADPAHRLGVRVITYSPWHALFAKTLFIEPTEDEFADHVPEALVLHAPDVEADPDADGTRSETFVVLHPTRGEVVIGGTEYAGEIKKSIFSLMNDRLPLEGVLPMHCSANVGEDGRRRDLLRALGHGQDDAFGRPVAAPDRRRRARVGRRGRLQHRGRLLREGDPPLARGRAADLPHDRIRSERCSRTSSPTSEASSTSTTTRRPRTRARPTSSSRSRTRCPRSAPATRATSSSSPRTPSGSCRRSRA